MFSLHLLRSFYVLICCAPERRNLNAAERDWARNHSILRWGSLAKMIGRQPWLYQAECKTYEARCWLDGSVGGTTCDVWSISKVNFHATRHPPPPPTSVSTFPLRSTLCVQTRVEYRGIDRCTYEECGMNFHAAACPLGAWGPKKAGKVGSRAK